MAANVAFIRPEISAYLPLYYVIRDVIAGEVSVKNARTLYLPMPNAEDKSPENMRRYDAYLKRAVFYNVARRTLLGMVGEVYSAEPVIKIPAMLEPLQANATGGGINLTQLSKQAMNFTLAYSRCGLFIDYPQVDSENGVSVLELEQGKIRPTMYVYSPQSIINWRTIDRGAEEVLSLVVIYEPYCSQDDGFEMKNSPQYRVLRLDEDGHYCQEIWKEEHPTKFDESKPKKGNFRPMETVYPTGPDGSYLTEIPFMFIGSQNNDPQPDNPNFYDICSLNLAHYRNSADYEESCYITGQPTPVVSGITEHWAKEVMGGKVTFGSNGGIMLPANASAELLQAEPNTMLKEAMDTKERQMVALGAKLVEQKTVQRTATEAGLEAATEASTLTSTTKNVSAAFTWGLKWAARFLGLQDTGIDFVLNTDFNIASLGSEEMRLVIEAWQKGTLSWKEMRDQLRRAKLATEDDETAKASIAKDTAEAMAMAAVANEPGDNVGNGE